MARNSNDWLAAICASTGKPIIAQPWTITIDGKRWRFASDGKLAVLLQDEAAQDKEAVGSTLLHIQGLLDWRLDRLGSTDVAAILEWTGPHQESRQDRCVNCMGDGVCTNCGCELPHPCGYCQGIGRTIGKPKCLPGRIAGGPLIDRNLLAIVIGRFDGPCEVFYGEGSAVEFRAASWRVIIMPVVGDSEDFGKYPSLTLNPPTATKVSKKRGKATAQPT